MSIVEADNHNTLLSYDTNELLAPMALYQKSLHYIFFLSIPKPSSSNFGGGEEQNKLEKK